MVVVSRLTGWGSFKLPGVPTPGTVFMVHCVFCTLAVKLPLLCAQTAEDPNKANLRIARAETVSFLNIILSPFGFSVPSAKDRVVTGWLLGDESASSRIKESPVFYSTRY